MTSSAERMWGNGTFIHCLWVQIAVIFLESYPLISVKIKNIPTLLSSNFTMGFVSLLNKWILSQRIWVPVFWNVSIGMSTGMYISLQHTCLWSTARNVLCILNSTANVKQFRSVTANKASGSTDHYCCGCTRVYVCVCAWMVQFWRAEHQFSEGFSFSSANNWPP